MRKTLVAATAAIGLMAGAAYAQDYVGTPSSPGSGETGYFHFKLLEYPNGNAFCIPATPATGVTDQGLQWSNMVEMRADTGRKVVVHAGGAAPQGCAGNNTSFSVTGIGSVD